MSLFLLLLPENLRFAKNSYQSILVFFFGKSRQWRHYLINKIFVSSENWDLPGPLSWPFEAPYNPNQWRLRSVASNSRQKRGQSSKKRGQSKNLGNTLQLHLASALPTGSDGGLRCRHKYFFSEIPETVSSAPQSSPRRWRFDPFRRTGEFPLFPSGAPHNRGGREK